MTLGVGEPRACPQYREKYWQEHTAGIPNLQSGQGCDLLWKNMEIQEKLQAEQYPKNLPVSRHCCSQPEGIPANTLLGRGALISALNFFSSSRRLQPVYMHRIHLGVKGESTPAVLRGTGVPGLSSGAAAREAGIRYYPVLRLWPPVHRLFGTEEFASNKNHCPETSGQRTPVSGARWGSERVLLVSRHGRGQSTPSPAPRLQAAKTRPEARGPACQVLTTPEDLPTLRVPYVSRKPPRSNAQVILNTIWSTSELNS